MTAFDAPPELNAELTLELARLSTEPGAADKSRNLSALRSRLGLPVTRASGLGSTAPVRTPSARAAAFAPWQQLVAVGVFAGTIGFFLGLGVDGALRRETERTLASANPPSAVAALGTLPSGARSLPAIDTSAKASAPSAATPSEPTPSETAPSETMPSAPSAARAAPARSSGGHEHRRAAAPPTSAASREPDFARAVQLLARAKRALDRAEPALALGLLDEMDASFPPELLDEERGATRVLGLCANGERAAALQLAQTLFAGRPRSIYSRRIERSCAGAALGARTAP